MSSLKVGKHEYELPDDWGKVSPAQFLRFAKFKSRKLSEMEILRKLVYSWSGMPAKVYLLMNFAQVTNIAQSLDWVFSESYPSKQMLPEVKAGGVTLYGPGDGLRHVLVKEWLCADPAIRAYQKDKSVQALDRLVCFLYRPEKKDAVMSGDRREEFNEFVCLDRLSLIDKASLAEKMAIAMNYIGMWSQLVIDFKRAFSGGGGGKSFGIPGMVHDLAGPELGTVQEIEQKWSIRNLLWIVEKNEIRRLEAKSTKQHD